MFNSADFAFGFLSVVLFVNSLVLACITIVALVVSSVFFVVVIFFVLNSFSWAFSINVFDTVTLTVDSFAVVVFAKFVFAVDVAFDELNVIAIAFLVFVFFGVIFIS